MIPATPREHAAELFYGVQDAGCSVYAVSELLRHCASCEAELDAPTLEGLARLMRLVSDRLVTISDQGHDACRDRP